MSSDIVVPGLVVSQTVTYDGNDIRMVADVFGDPADPPVILLHGGGQTRHAWGGTAATLAENGWYCIVLDLRGHGDTDWSKDGDYKMETYAEDLHAVIATLDRKPVLVGASMGGLISLLTEGESPESVAEAIVLVDVAPRLEPEGVQRIVGFMTAHPEGFPSLEDAADVIAGYTPERQGKRTKNLDGLKKNLRLGEDGRYRWHWDPAFLSGPRASSDPDRLFRAARNLRVPALLVRGKLSDLVSEEGAKEFLDSAPNARYVDVSGAGHMVAGDRNDAFTQAVLEFLEDVAAGTLPVAGG